MPSHEFNDTTQHDLDLKVLRYLKWISKTCSFSAFLLGAVGLVGWVRHIPTFTRFVMNSPRIMPNTAVALILCSLSLELQTLSTSAGPKKNLSLIGRAIALPVIVGSVLTLTEYLTHRSLGLDSIFLQIAIDEFNPGRPAPETAVGFLLTGLGLFLFNCKTIVKTEFCHYLFLSSGCLALLVIFHFVTEHTTDHSVFGEFAKGMALNTALGLLLLSIGIVSAKSKEGFMPLILSRSTGGFVIRRLLVAVLFIPPAPWLFKLLFEFLGNKDPAFTESLSILFTMLIFLTLSWSISETLRASDHQKEQLQNLRDQWNALIAHDIRQPLTRISLFANLLSKITGGKEAEKNLINGILESSQTLKRMIDDLLDVSKIEANQLTIEPRHLAFDSFIAKFIEKTVLFYPNSKIKWHRLDPIAELKTDPERLEQILQNLVSNAIKYSFPESEILLKTQKRNDHVHISIINEGPGLSPQDMSHLFLRFSRAASAQKSSTPGLGLGLYICKGLVEAQGGKIWVESTPGKKTVFSFSLPLKEIRAEKHEKAA